MQTTLSPAFETREVRLTPREREILIILATTGNESKQIAEDLKIGKRTVDFHLGNVFEKIPVENRTQAIIWAWRSGLVTA